MTVEGQGGTFENVYNLGIDPNQSPPFMYYSYPPTQTGNIPEMTYSHLQQPLSPMNPYLQTSGPNPNVDSSTFMVYDPRQQPTRANTNSSGHSYGTPSGSRMQPQLIPIQFNSQYAASAGSHHQQPQYIIISPSTNMNPFPPSNWQYYTPQPMPEYSFPVFNNQYYYPQQFPSHQYPAWQGPGHYVVRDERVSGDRKPSASDVPHVDDDDEGNDEDLDNEDNESSESL